MDELEDNQNYVCLCNNECFKKVEYSSQPLSQTTKSTNRLSRVLRPASPLRNGTNGHTNSNGLLKVNERDNFVHPRIVTLIRNGTKPRRILRLLLNKRNSPSYEHVLTAITQCVKLDTGCVRKVYTQNGQSVTTLADFFGTEEVFFAYGTERMSPDDFKLEADELKIVQQSRKTLRNGSARNGPKPKMPTKNSVNLHNAAYEGMDEALQHESGIDPSSLPDVIQNRYHLGPIIGAGNFAIVLKTKRKSDGKHFALKIIDKSKCKGKEHYIDAEVRVMKKLQHPHIMSLILDVDTYENMFLVLEYISGNVLHLLYTIEFRIISISMLIFIFGQAEIYLMPLQGSHDFLSLSHVP